MATVMAGAAFRSLHSSTEKTAVGFLSRQGDRNDGVTGLSHPRTSIAFVPMLFGQNIEIEMGLWVCEHSLLSPRYSPCKNLFN
jgi:hypothetical protein